MVIIATAAVEHIAVGAAIQQIVAIAAAEQIIAPLDPDSVQGRVADRAGQAVDVGAGAIAVGGCQRRPIKRHLWRALVNSETHRHWLRLSRAAPVAGAYTQQMGADRRHVDLVEALQSSRHLAAPGVASDGRRVARAAGRLIERLDFSRAQGMVEDSDLVAAALRSTNKGLQQGFTPCVLLAQGYG